MNNLTQTELAKIRKAALHSLTLTSDIKATVVEARFKELTQDIKKILAKKDVVLEIVFLKIKN